MAWHKICRKYMPRSLARAVRLMGQVTNPPKIKEIQNVEQSLDKWEQLVKTLHADFNEEFKPLMKLGIVTTMVPATVQELIYQSLGEGDIDFEEIMAKIRAMVSNKVAMMSGPTAMDIGRLEFREYDESYEEEDRTWVR